MAKSSFKPLNPALFDAVSDYFEHVRVIAPGQGALIQPVGLAVRRTGNDDSNWTKLKLVTSGEEYAVNCPFCNDTRQRLYINHLFGTYSEDWDRRLFFAIQCWNENCLSDPLLQHQLYDRLFDLRGRAAKDGRMVVYKGEVEARELTHMSFPGPVTRIDKLAESDPDSMPVQYLLSRGLDPKFLAQNYRVGFCHRSDRYDLATNRIFIPVYDKVDGKACMVGWQCRWPDDLYYGEPFNIARIPKYYTSPGFPRRLTMYNVLEAQQYSTIVIVEGPTDVWHTGPYCMGLLSKKFTDEQLARLADIALEFGTKNFVILLDPDQDQRSKERGKPHHIDVAAKKLRDRVDLPVIKVYLPAGTDPGQFDREFTEAAMRKAAADVDEELCFRKVT